jgi:hypothetical protein
MRAYAQAHGQLFLPQSLQLADRTDPLTEVVAKKIIEHARRGERDPRRLREIVLKELNGNR